MSERSEPSFSVSSSDGKQEIDEGCVSGKALDYMPTYSKECWHVILACEAISCAVEIVRQIASMKQKGFGNF